jgi:MFS transporter, putative metabolite:H+ symporter
MDQTTRPIAEQDSTCGDFIQLPSCAAARLDRLPILPFHKKLLLLIGAGLFLDGFEIYIGGTVTAELLRIGMSSLQQSATFVTMTFIGFMVGAWSAGVLGDRFGRRFSYQLNLAIYGLASLAATFAPNMEILIALRFIMGIGLGAELVIGYSTVSEFIPPQSRGRMVALVALMSNSAVFFASFTSLWVIPNLGWRCMFLIVGVGALILWILRQSMTESPRWLESQGRYAEADAILRKIEAEADPTILVSSIPSNASAAVTPQGRVPTSVLFQKRVLPRTIVASSIQVVIFFTLYGLVNWLPSFFVKQGFDIVRSLTWTTVMSLGGPVGGLIGYLIADRIGRKPAIIVAALTAALFGVAYQFVRDQYMLLGIGFLLVTSVYTMVIMGQLYLPELFDTPYRLRGTGFASTVGRLNAAVVQFFIIWLFTLGGVSAVVGTVAFTLFLLSLIVAALGIETKQKPLEQVV